jgi:DNA helicase-2/ATP-dependent DNA helicase PcrA
LGKPNVFVVGDDDQSIYRFQGANVENMLAFAQSFEKDLLKVVLQNNYRSIQPILDISKILIQQNKDRLINQVEGLTKELIASNTNINHLTNSCFSGLRNPKQEMVDITLQIETLIQQGVQPGKIGVLYKENKYGDTLTEFLKLKNIPVYSKRDLNLFHIPLAQKIILLLEYLAAEHDTPYGGDEMLFSILHFNWLNIPPIEIAKLSIEVAEKQFGVNKTSLRKLLFDKSNQPSKDLFAVAVNPNLKKASAIIEALITDAANLTVQHLLEHIIKNTDC